MNFKTLIIHKNKILFNILNEIGSNLNLKIIDDNDVNLEDFKDYLYITTKQNSSLENQLFLNKFPIKIKELIDMINVNFLKRKYNSQSDIGVGFYKLNLNSRILYKDETILELTEMEANLILYLKNSINAVNIKELQKKVWGQMPNLETHTVETHIYRLRKKIKDKFNDNRFINSTKNGYEIIEKK